MFEKTVLPLWCGLGVVCYDALYEIIRFPGSSDTVSWTLWSGILNEIQSKQQGNRLLSPWFGIRNGVSRSFQRYNQDLYQPNEVERRIEQRGNPITRGRFQDGFLVNFEAFWVSILAIQTKSLNVTFLFFTGTKMLEQILIE